MTAVAELVISAPIEPWQRIGLYLAGIVAQVGGARLRFVDGADGLIGWGLADAPISEASIDGLPTHVSHISSSEPSPHVLRMSSIDHVVVITSSIERTCTEIERITGEPLKRIRQAGSVRQGFHRLGEVIVEVVEHADHDALLASFWGFVGNVDDIHGTCDALGPDVISRSRPAVQPGRFIATFRESVGLCLPLAIMSPPISRREP